MSYSSIFTFSLIIFSIFFGIMAVYTLFYINKQNIRKNEKIPRNIILGVIFATIDIAWCIPQALSIFSPNSFNWIFPTAIICLVISCLFLDYLFARAFAGFLILLSHYFLLESFAAGIPCMVIFSTACYIMGTFGIVVGGIPHLLRDLIRKISNEKVWRIVFTAIFACYCVLGLIVSFSLIIK